MKKILLFKFLFIFTIFFTNNLLATHIPGGNITYENIGPNTFVITLTVFEDCGGSATIGAGNQTVVASNTCGLTSPTITLPNVIFQSEASQLCSQFLGQGECNGGTFPGVYMHVWRDTITLPGGCDSWLFTWDSCCRNNSINADGGTDDLYIETVLNSVTSPTNSSPVITSNPIPYNCLNQPVNYSFGVFEPDGDSLHYSLVSAMIGNGQLINYFPGYSGASPINGININPNTGEITFTPTIQGNFVVAVLIEEFNSNGDLVGSVLQDFQFEIIICQNLTPSPPAGGITNLIGADTLPGSFGFGIEACVGDSICFDMLFLDSNLNDVLTVTSNITQLFPGSTFLQIDTTSPVTASFCMVVLPGTNPITPINVTVTDDACPVNGSSSFVIVLSVISSTYAGPDVTMCFGVPASLNSSGGSNFNWNVISGDPISIGNNFSCNGCPNPVVNPAYSTVYEVVSNLSGGCSNTDTISVDVVPDFNYSLTQSATTTCLNSSIQFNASPSPSGSYSYQWSPATFLTNPNTATPEFNTSVPGLYEYEVTIVSNLGCVKVDTLSVNVLPAYSPDITLTASDTNVFCGDTVYLDAGLGGGVPAFCGPSGATSCNAPSSFQTVGTDMGANSGNQYPSPFGHYYKSVKEQYLFRAAELIAAGFSGGKITEIAWETIAQNGATDSLNSYTIKMGCTNQNILSSWQGGLTTVFSPQNITVVLGANDFVFTTAYEWDGISNLIVEICFNNIPSGNPYTLNWSVPHQIFPYNTSLNLKSDLNNVCPSLTAPLAGNKRPVTKFKTCPTIPDPNNFSFQWTPPSFLSSTSDQSPYSIPFVSTYYNVVVTDSNGGCTDTASIFINVLCDTCDKPVPTINGITCYGGSDGSITGIPSGVNGPPWILQLMDGFSNVTFGIDSNVTDSVVFDNLSAGNYVLRSLDTTGCYADTAITIPDLGPFVVTLNNDSICGSYNFNGTIISSPGTYYDTLYSILGCVDSVIILTLTTNSSYSNDTITSCSPYTWIDGITYTASNNTATFTIQNAAGCDSVVTLDLTITQGSTGTDVISSCDSITWIDGITYTTSNNTATYTLSNATGCDSIVTLNLTISSGFLSEETISACDSLLWSVNGNTYTQTGIYYDSLQSSNGCDSVYKLDLTLNSSSSSLFITSSCLSYTWNGQVLLASGIYLDTNVNAAGCLQFDSLDLTITPTPTVFNELACDSFPWNGTSYTTSGTYTTIGTCVDTLNLTINNSSSSISSLSSCDSVNWNGSTYSVTGIYNFITTNSVGCDSTATLNLNINSGSISQLSITVCDSYLWNGISYNQNGTYYDSLQNITGCDSVVTLNLTINNSYSSLINITACDSYSWNGVSYNVSGTYTYSSLTASGCDSIVTLNLTINNSYSNTDTINSCNSYSWNGTTYNQSGTYYDSSSTVNGCDSINILSLIVSGNIFSLDTAAACQSYIWNGNQYDSSGIYIDTIISLVGCDSIKTLYLTINDDVTSPITLELLLDDYCLETYWNVKDSRDSVWYSGQNYNCNPSGGGTQANTIINKKMYLDPNDCYTFELGDVYGDGLGASFWGGVDGSWLIKDFNNLVIGQGQGDFGFIVEYSFLVGQSFVTNIIENEALQAGVSIYPNPTNENITISIENFTGNIQTEIYDLIGNRLQTTNETTISLSDYARGIYLLKVAYSDRVEEVKVIKD